MPTGEYGLTGWINKAESQRSYKGDGQTTLYTGDWWLECLQQERQDHTIQGKEKYWLGFGK